MIVTPDQWVPQPWKNGGGTTHELWREPHGDGFALRVSVADVTTDGPFSRFPGIDRTIVMLEGKGFTLTRDDGLVVRIGTEPFAFHGEDGWTAKLVDGPVRDFNVMVDRSALRATVQVHVAPTRPTLCGRWLLFAVDGPVAVDGREVPRWSLVGGQGPVRVDGSGRVLVVGLV